MHFSTTTTSKFLSRTCDYVQQPNVIGWTDGGGNNTRKVGRQTRHNSEVHLGFFFAFEKIIIVKAFKRYVTDRSIVNLLIKNQPY